jgi:DNA segregation ATPase FtsK/SpoIIIE, S-DNA-T family
VPEPVVIGVSDVRREIYKASEFAAGEGQATTALLGSLFHRVFRALMDPEAECGWPNVLDRESLGDSERLQNEIYAALVAPHLIENQAKLQSAAREVLTMWEATGHLCRQVCHLLTNSCHEKLLEYDAGRNRWLGAEQFSAEEKLTWLVEDPSWSAPVLVCGVADAVWRNPASKRWCVLELKLGSGSSDADLAQLCLYHEMLCAGTGNGAGHLTLWHFQPELKYSQFSGEQLECVRAKLRALIGRIAGVAPAMDNPAPAEAHRELGRRLVQVLEQFGPMATLESDPVVGPNFLRFHLMPEPGVKVEKILPLGKNVAVQLRLASALISLEDGKLVVDLQRPDRETLRFREFRPLLPRTERGNAKVLVGVDFQRRPRFVDLSSECPHILAAGTAGSGKSEWLRMAMASLLATNTPQTLKLMIIDPKRVTFGELEGSPYLLDSGKLLHTPKEALGGLLRLSEIMEERYRLFAEKGVPDLEALKKRGDEAPPRIVCFCDEYGNLVAQKKDREPIESAITQLGAKARAAGIHLILATQDPRAQILTPSLKTNLDGRVCLRTSSSTQSRMMLEQNGAESLLGHGDLLYKVTGEPVRLQAPLLEDAERAEIYQAR